jgi:hypothetical protein
MRSEVNVIVGGQEFSFSLEGHAPQALEAARKWLDAQFVALECEPLRASGKLLMADKVVVIARDAGAKQFADAAWGAAFAAATSAVLGKKMVQVDADALSVTY